MLYYLDPHTISEFGKTATAQTLCAGMWMVCLQFPDPSHTRTVRSSPPVTRPPSPLISASLEVVVNFIFITRKAESAKETMKIIYRDELQ